MELLPELREIIKTSTDPLDMAARVASAGNIIDLGIQIDYDLHASLEHILAEGFVLNDLPVMIADLQKREAANNPGQVLYICDNAGEIAFDRLFLEVLVEHFPKTHFVATVNGLPILNDATLEDAVEVGLTDIVPVITNGEHYDFLGTLLEQVSPEFLSAYQDADWVISKGQANYETLEGLSDKILFLLKAKCEEVADHLGIDYFQGLCKRGNVNR
jgi:uncharacterized protein with ATP-grasp and redox domains